MVSLRTPEGKKKYHEYLESQAPSAGCDLCEKKSLRNFTYWKITENSFPYDKIAELHHMLMPIRHISEDQLNTEELAELKNIKETYVNASYDWIIEATRKNKSIPLHFHLHLLVGKT